VISAPMYNIHNERFLVDFEEEDKVDNVQVYCSNGVNYVNCVGHASVEQINYLIQRCEENVENIITFV